MHRLTRPIGLVVEPSLYEEIAAAAAREDRTLSDYVRLQLKRVVEHEQKARRETVPAGRHRDEE